MGFFDSLSMWLGAKLAEKAGPSIEQGIKDLADDIFSGGKKSLENQVRFCVQRIFDNINRIELSTKNLKKKALLDGIIYVRYSIDNDKYIPYIMDIIKDTENIPIEVRKKYPDVPWEDIDNMKKGLLRYNYSNEILFNQEKVWKIVKKKIPAIKPSIKRMHEDLKKIVNTK